MVSRGFQYGIHGREVIKGDERQIIDLSVRGVLWVGFRAQGVVERSQGGFRMHAPRGGLYQ